MNHYANEIFELNQRIKNAMDDLENQSTKLKQIMIAIHTIENIDKCKHLNSKEIELIVNNMDLTNYIEHACYDRFIDLNTILSVIVSYKEQYPSSRLSKITLLEKSHSLPPRNTYKYEYE